MVLPRTLVAVALLLLAAGTANARALKQDIPFMANAQPIKLRVSISGAASTTRLTPPIWPQYMHVLHCSMYCSLCIVYTDQLYTLQCILV